MGFSIPIQLFSRSGGVSGNESGSLASDLALLRADKSEPKDPEEQKRRMEQRKVGGFDGFCGLGWQR